MFVCSFVSTFRYLLLQTKSLLLSSSSLIIFKRQYSTICQTAKIQHIEADVKKRKKLHRTSYWQISAEYWSGTERFASLHRGTWLRC